MAAPTVYRVRAHNAATESENRIHDDEVARRHGFRGGLVPGVTVYAYMTHPVVARLGRAWLERGTITARFHQPLYDGDTVTVDAAAVDADRAHGFLGQLDDDLELYGRDRIAHPGWLLRAANDVLAANVRLGPWIHTASAVTNLGVVNDGDRVATRARLSALSTRKGHELVELDVLLLANRDRPVTHIRHTAIYRLREPGAAT